MNQTKAVMLLLIFLIGQFIVYAHSHAHEHTPKAYAAAKKQHVDHSNCSICDQNAHVQIVFAFEQPTLVLPTVHMEYGLFVLEEHTVHVFLSDYRGPPCCIS